MKLKRTKQPAANIAVRTTRPLNLVLGVIERFSEDIDLILDWRVLGGEDPLAKRSKTKQGKLKGGGGEQRVVEVMESLLKAIAHCHASNIVHRDIKPENVMVGEDGEIKLIDFGLSQQTLSKHSKMHMLVGTPLYMSPQVIEGYYGRECDIWSLGVLMFLLLSGRLPFYSKKVDELFDKILDGSF